MLTTEQINLLWLDDDFKKDVRFCANVIAQFIISEPNYGIDLLNPSDPVQVRVSSYWQKRYSLANRVIQNPEDQYLLKTLIFTLVSGISGIDTPISFNGNDPVYTLWIVQETDSIAGFLKAAWNNMSGVRSNEYPWAGENGSIAEPTDPNWYANHFSDLPNKF